MYSSLSKLEIAETQLRQSVVLYMTGTDLISTVTLAGAADEILVKMARANGETSALDDDVKSLCKMHEAAFGEKPDPKTYVELRNRARNEFKHLGQDDITELDLEVEAQKILSRAIRNYKKLKPQFDRQLRDFELEAIRRYRAEQLRIVSGGP